MKNIKFIAVLASLAAFSGMALADGMTFEPVDVNVTPVDKNASSAAAEPSFVNTAAAENFQTAILQLDSAQVELRNSYLSYKEKYQQVDTQYKAVKAERKATHKAVKSLEKKIKQIENEKAKIRKTMQ